MRVGVVGTGAMGRHHVRLLAAMPDAELVGICDRDPQVAAAVAERHECRVYESLDALTERVDAVVLAIPTVQHAEIGVELLRRGLHVLMEKPIASSLEEADALVAAAERSVLSVGHVEFFNPAVQKLLSLDAPPGFLEIHRMAAFKPRSLDIDVVLDLMIHDIQVLHALDTSPIAEIRATGINVLTDRVDIASARIELESGCVANITASRISAESIRKLRVFLRNTYYSLDYHEQTLRGVRLDVGSPDRQLRPDNPRVEHGNPLRLELEAFLSACRGEPSVIVDGAGGRRALGTALRVAEAIEGEKTHG